MKLTSEQSAILASTIGEILYGPDFDSSRLGVSVETLSALSKRIQAGATTFSEREMALFKECIELAFQKIDNEDEFQTRLGITKQEMKVLLASLLRD